jgi:hypothetical protein
MVDETTTLMTQMKGRTARELSVEGAALKVRYSLYDLFPIQWLPRCPTPTSSLTQFQTPNQLQT